MEELDANLIDELLKLPETRSYSRSEEPDINLVDEMWIAWSAGFIDGEGAIMIMRTHKQTGLIVRASQSIEAPLDRLRLMYGGSVSKTNRGIYQWSIYGRLACKALAAMRPYMMVKGTHADLAIEFQERCIGDGSKNSNNELKEWYYEEIGKLQVKGANNRKRPKTAF